MAKNGNYIELYDSDGRYYEHRRVASKILGRVLKDDECVHHINGIGNDNRKENIWIFRTIAHHSRFHKTGVAILQSDGTYIAEGKMPKNKCPICNELCFGKYCSPQHASFAQRKVERPAIPHILEMLDKMSFSAVGRHFGVSDNAIRKWIKIKRS